MDSKSRRVHKKLCKNENDELCDGCITSIGIFYTK